MMKKLKLFFACLLMAVLSIGQMWAGTPLTATLQISSGVTANGNLTDNQSNTWTVSSDGSYTSNNSYIQCGTNSKSVSYIRLTTSAYSSYKITKVQVWGTSKANTNVKAKITIGSTQIGESASAYSTQNASSGGTELAANNTSDASGDITIEISRPTSANGAIYFNKLIVTYEEAGGSSDPTVSADPDEVEDVVAEGVTNETIDLTYENITDYETEVTVHPNADGTGTLSSAWLTASVSDADDYATITYSVSANDGAARTAYIKVYTTDGDKEAETIIPVSQVKYSAPTGTFELFSGDLEEGDYVFVVDAKAMTNSVSSSRLANTNVTIATDQITNPDESIIWHVAASGDYWTIYNAAVEKYAASNGTKNQAALTATEDDKILWSVDKSGNAFNFENKYNAANSVNAKLQRNGDYGWACYASYSNISLYKKQVAGQPKAPTFSIPSGNYETAQSVELSCETEGATIYYTTNGDAPTSSSTQYNGTAIAVDHTMTIKAIAIKNEISSTVASATYTIIVWQTVADVWDDITVDGPLNAHIYGYVSQTNVSGYANNFYISDNGSTEGNQLYAYRMNMNSFSVAVGDKVKLAGDLTEYQGTKEFKYANSGATQGLVVALEAKGALQSVAVSGTPTKTEYASGEDFDPAGLKVYGTYANGFVGEITEGITWGNDLTDGKVTESTTVHVTATVSEIASPAYDVAVTVAAKTLLSIAVDVDSYTIYTGEALPQPNVTATYSEGDPENVNAFAVYDSENAFNTATIDDPDPQTITVSYTFGGETKTSTYTVSVQDYENANDAPYSVTEALHIITAAIGNVESAREIVVTGTVSAEKVSNYKNRYKISDGANELLVYNGKGFNDEAFTDANYPKVGDVMVVKGKVIYFNNNTPEFASGKSYPLSQIRPATIAIEDVASFEVGADDLAVTDLTVTTPSDGDITFVSGDEAVATIEANAIHAVAPGTVTITANLAATENVDALNYAATSTTFSVTVVAPATKYAITFDGNGADGGDAPDAIADKAAGAEVTLPANSYTKTGYVFDGWKVYDENEDEVSVTAGVFEMPASDVTIKAQWAEISVWATTYTSNVTLTAGSNAQNAKVVISETEYDAVKVGTGKAGGNVTVTVPAQATKLHLHAAGWSGENPVISITAPDGVTVSPASISATADAGISSNSPFTLENDPVGQYFALSLSGNTEEIELTFAVDGGNKRFVLFGVNQEGGVLPVLDHITITGTMTNTTGWKTGDNIVPEGLTVNAIYTLNNVEQTPVEVDPNDVVWSHAALVENQTEVTLTATYEGKNANKVVTIAAVETGDPTIITEPASYLNFGASVVKDAVVDPKTITVTLKNITNATATLGGTNYSAFSIDNTAVVDGTVITVSVNTGTVGTYEGTVTIKDDNSETQKVITLSMTVVEPEVPETAVATDSKWVAAVAADIKDGAVVLITGVKDDVTYAIGVQNDNNRAAVAGTLDEGVFTPGENTMAFTLVAQEGGTFALRASNGEYLYAASSSKNYLKRQANIDDNAKWTLTATSAVANGSNTHNDLKFNATNSPKIFSCYSSGQTEIKFYVPKPATPEPPVVTYTEVRNGLTEGWYYTMCLDKAVTAVKAGSIWRVLSKAANGNDVILEEAELPLVAGRPYIFRAAASTLEVAYTGDEVGAPVNDEDNNGLVGSFTEEPLAQNSNHYIIYNNALYYVNSDNVKVGAHRAYLDMTGVPAYNSNNEPQQGAPRRRVTMAVHGEQTTTGIDTLNAAEAPVKMIIDGQLFIIRGEKMFDATGRLVK